MILILNVGGPSQLDTWDPKPDAPAEVRGPFRAIQTEVPGLVLSELFPRHAAIASRVAFIRSCHHDAPAVHEIGWQLAQTGREFPADAPEPHVGSVIGQLAHRPRHLPPHVVLPAVLHKRHCRLPTGQPLQSAITPAQRASEFVSGGVGTEPERVRQRYGHSRLGTSLLAARRLIERGVRFVTVNTALDVRDRASWDVHGTRPFGTVAGMKEVTAPVYDQACTALIEDLADRGLLPETLVCCVAEFGRTPRMNPAGGRDHWPRCWTVYLAGGGVRGGQVIGRSDRFASEPLDRPVTPAQLVATIYYALGIDIPGRLPYGDTTGRVCRDPDPIAELF